MSLKKKFLKSKPICKVTFNLPAKAAPKAKEVTLVGDFNEWSETRNKMTRLKSGAFKIELPLASEKEYQFRYLIDGELWENDWEADQYLPTPIAGVDNSVVNTQQA